MRQERRSSSLRLVAVVATGCLLADGTSAQAQVQRDRVVEVKPSPVDLMQVDREYSDVLAAGSILEIVRARTEQLRDKSAAVDRELNARKSILPCVLMFSCGAIDSLSSKSMAIKVELNQVGARQALAAEKYEDATTKYNASYFDKVAQGMWLVDEDFLRLPVVQQKLPIAVSPEVTTVVFRFNKIELPDGVKVDIKAGGITVDSFSGKELTFTNGLSRAIPRAEDLAIVLTDERANKTPLVSLRELFRSHLEMSSAARNDAPPETADKSRNEVVEEPPSKGLNETLCVLSSDRRQPFKSSFIGQVFWLSPQDGNVYGARGTAFRLERGYLASAGHVFSDLSQHVAMDNPVDGFQVWFKPDQREIPSLELRPTPEHLFYIKFDGFACAECFLDNPGVDEPQDMPGNDWAVFEVLPNKTTKKTLAETFADDGYFRLPSTAHIPTNQVVFVAGFGKSNTTAIDKKSQIGAGIVRDSRPNDAGHTAMIKHDVDTTKGSSGAPVFMIDGLAGDAKPEIVAAQMSQKSIALGIHDGGDCQVGGNEATSFYSPQLHVALVKRGLIK